MDTWLKYLVAAACVVVIAGFGYGAIRDREAQAEQARDQRFAAEARVCLEEFEAGVVSRQPAGSFYECFRTGRLDLATVNRVMVRHGFAPLKL
jgi:hypothetical protein